MSQCAYTPAALESSTPAVVPDETTRLLHHNGDELGATDATTKNRTVHYKDIDGTRFWCLFSSILLAYLLVYFDSFFLASSHPIITSYFNASNAASWLSTVFYLSSTISGPFYGRVSDITGRRTMYMFALTIFTLTTAWCGAAQSITSFIAARLFCGLGAGGVASMSNIILSDVVKIEYRGIYQSYLNLAFGLGNSLGASLGGLICERIGWRAAFYIQIPLIVVLTIFAYLTTPRDLGPSLAKAEKKSIREALSTFDVVGAIMLCLSITGLILGINLGGSILPWTHPIVITSLVAFVLASIGLVLAESRAFRPLLPLDLLSKVPYGNLNWGNLLGAMLSATTNFNVPLFLAAVKQTSPTQSGLILLSPLIGILVTSVAVGFAISWTRKLKPFMVAGGLSQLGGMVACGMLRPEIPLAGIVSMIPWVSIGQGFFFPASTVGTLAIASKDEQAVVVTTLNLSRSLGSILGIAVSSWIFQNALLLFLARDITGDEDTKMQIVLQVRKSVRAIASLSPAHKSEAIRAYASATQITFLSCASLAIFLCAIIVPIKLPELRSEGDNEDQTAADPDSD